MFLTPEQIESYGQTGILVLDGCFSDSEIDGVNRELDQYWSGAKPTYVSDFDGTRIQDAWTISKYVHNMATNKRVLAILESLYGIKPRPFQTLNFVKGSQQDPHVDYIHFNSEPFGMMCGVWVALEDVGPDQGPLLYYPRSHLLKEISFESLGLVASQSSYAQFLVHLEGLIQEQGLEPQLGLLKKGQMAIWSAGTCHGGIKQNDPSLNRLSQVTHYYFEGGRYWRPFFSEYGRAYFRPNWIPARPGPAPLEAIKRMSNGLINKSVIAAKRITSKHS